MNFSFAGKTALIVQNLAMVNAQRAGTWIAKESVFMKTMDVGYAKVLARQYKQLVMAYVLMIFGRAMKIVLVK